MKPYLVKVNLEVEVDSPDAREAEASVEDALLDALEYDRTGGAGLLEFTTIELVAASPVREDNLPPQPEPEEEN